MNENVSQQGILISTSEYRTLIFLQMKYDMLCELLQEDKSTYGLTSESTNIMRIITGIKNQEETK